jgi:signal transduction histidine kinase
VNAPSANPPPSKPEVSFIGQLLKFTSTDPEGDAWRVYRFERDIILAVKALVLPLLFYYLFLTNWMEEPPLIHRAAFGESAWRVAHRVIQYAFLLYLAVNIATAFLLLGMRSARDLSTGLLQGIVFGVNLLDAVFLGGLVLVTGGLESTLFWLFPFLIVRNALSVAAPTPQVILNLLTTASYVVAILVASLIARRDALSAASTGVLSEVASPWGASFYLRVGLLLTIAGWLLGLRILLERQQRQAEEQTEMMVRSEQLHATGRLAAEIAHKLKNPLAIINNASYTLQRTVKEGKGTITQQIQIIREEVDRSDRLITELMGFAQLAEGRVERVDVREEIERAIQQVFPEAVKYEVNIYRDYGAGVPPLLLQRNHLAETLVNILHNAREIMKGRGNLWIRTRTTGEQTVEITITDDGPGIAPNQIHRIFEPYFTTREKGSGLGLAIAKHNVEIYGGQLRVESELGRGSSFILEFPFRSMMRLRK